MVAGGSAQVCDCEMLVDHKIHSKVLNSFRTVNPHNYRWLRGNFQKKGGMGNMKNGVLQVEQCARTFVLWSVDLTVLLTVLPCFSIFSDFPGQCHV